MADAPKTNAPAPAPAASGPVSVVVQGTPVAAYASGKPVKAYKLKAGKKHTHDGEAVKAGDAVYLTENQAKAFADKFDAADGSGFKVATHADLVALRPKEESSATPAGAEPKVQVVNT